MDFEILEKVMEKNKNGEKVALVTLIESKGSAPRKEGTMMMVYADGFFGTIGGGMLEYKVIEKAKEKLLIGKNSLFEYDLTQEKELGMSCGGSVKGYIKIFSPKDRVVIVGAGHIGKKMKKLLEDSEFEVVVLDDRDENLEAGVIVGEYIESINSLGDNPNTYFVIVTKGHNTDYKALKEILKKKSKYIGMIGSKKKVREIKDQLEKENVYIPKEKFYSPIGLKISNGTPYEIAIEIISEILVVKNGGSLEHRRI